MKKITMILLLIITTTMFSSCDKEVVLEQTVEYYDIINSNMILFETKIYTRKEPSPNILTLDTIVHDYVNLRDLDSVRFARVKELLPRFKELKDELGKEYVPIIKLGNLKEGVVINSQDNENF